MKRIKTTKLAVAAMSLACLAALSGCGGGASGESTPSAKISSVRVFGDSLADSGTFGYKFTVQTAGNYIFAERVAMAYGQTLCNYYAATSADTFVVNPKAGCTSYAIGAGVILHPDPTNPKGIMLQLATAGATPYSATEMALIDGGGNDAANLVGAFLAAQQGNPTSLFTLLGAMLTPAQFQAAQQAAATGNAAGLAAAGSQFMTNLADTFYASITANVLNKGATHVVIANIPDITLTPRFQLVLASIGAAQGAATQQQLQIVFQGWITAFNNEIAAKAASDTRVAVVDIYSNFQDEVANPAQYTLTNVKTPACPAVGVGDDHLPVYDFPHCTPTTAAAGWQTYLFSDGFHPTPFGHQLAAQLISRSITQKGWL